MGDRFPPYVPTRPYVEIAPGYESWTEKQFQNAIVHDFMGFFGWRRSYHNLYAVGSDKGFPDLTIVKPGQSGGVVWLEVKGGSGKSRVMPEQVEWMEDLQSTAHHAYIVYPEDMWLVQGILKLDMHTPYSIGGTIHVDPRLHGLKYYRDKARKESR